MSVCLYDVVNMFRCVSQADIFSIGAMLYEMVTLEIPKCEHTGVLMSVSRELCTR